MVEITDMHMTSRQKSFWENPTKEIRNKVSVPIRLFNRMVEGGAVGDKVDIFGNPIGRLILPDQKVTPRSYEAETPRKSASKSVSASKKHEAFRRDSNFTSPRVNLLPELKDLMTPRGQSISLELVPGMVKEFVTPEVGTLHGSCEWPENSAPRFIRSKGIYQSQQVGNSESESSFKLDLTYKSKLLLADSAGMLPADTARHDQREKHDKIYTSRQHFSLRETLTTIPPASPRNAPPQREESKSKRYPHVRGNEPTSEASSKAPTKAEQSFRLARKIVEDKMFEAKYELDGRGGHILRAEPKFFEIPKSPRNQRSKELLEKNAIVLTPKQKILFIKEHAEQRNERFDEVSGRRKANEEKFRQWQMHVLEKTNAQQIVLSSEENEIAHKIEIRIQKLWLSCIIHHKVERKLHEIRMHAREKAKMMFTSASQIQKFMKVKMMTVRLRKRMAMMKIVSRLNWMIAGWRARRKMKMANILILTLQEHKQNNVMKRAMSNFVYNVRRLQRVMRTKLLRDHARLAVLSRQWDRTFSFLRAATKQGTFLHPKKKTHSVSPMTSTARRLGRRHAICSTTDLRMESHFFVHVMLSRKQVCLLICLKKVPSLKWSTLRSLLQHMNVEYSEGLKQYAAELIDYAAFLEKKKAAEQVLLSLANDAESGGVLAQKLLGSSWHRKPPVTPRFHPVLPPIMMQTIMVDCLSRIVPSSIDDLEGNENGGSDEYDK